MKFIHLHKSADLIWRKVSRVSARAKWCCILYICTPNSSTSTSCLDTVDTSGPISRGKMWVLLGYRVTRTRVRDFEGDEKPRRDTWNKTSFFRRGGVVEALVHFGVSNFLNRFSDYCTENWYSGSSDMLNAHFEYDIRFSIWGMCEVLCAFTRMLLNFTRIFFHIFSDIIVVLCWKEN